MKVYVLSKALKEDPLEIDSIWSTYELAEARAKQFDSDEYYERYGIFQIAEWNIDDANR